MLNEIMPYLAVLALIITTFGIIIILLGFIIATSIFLSSRSKDTKRNRLEDYKKALGRTILLGLEVLIAATIIKTIIVNPTLYSVGLLTAIIAIRTLINWTISAELYGKWPWESSDTDG